LQESIDSVKFSKNGQYLAYADVDGLIKIYSATDFTFVAEVDLGDEFKVGAYTYLPAYVTF